MREPSRQTKRSDTRSPVVKRRLREQRGRVSRKRHHAQPLQRGDTGAERRRGRLRFLPEREGVLIDKIGRAVRRAQIQKLVAAVAVDVAGDELGAVGAQKHVAGPARERIYAQNGQTRGDLPRNEKLLLSVAGEIGIVDPPDGRAFAGDGEREPVFAVFGIVDIDLGVLRSVAEEGERLVGAVAVHVAELHALAVAAVDGCGIFAAGGKLLIDERLELPVFLRGHRKREILIDCCGIAAAQTEKQRSKQQKSPRPDKSFHSLSPFFQCINRQNYITISTLKMEYRKRNIFSCQRHISAV